MDSQHSWIDDANAISAIALTWYHTFAGNQYYQPQTGVMVTTPQGAASITAAPLVWLLLIGLAIWLIAK